jgi:hypothetical protein
MEQGSTGQILTDDDEREALEALLSVCLKAKVEPFTTKSDFARTFANEIALCACEGFISTALDDSYTNRWMVTAYGLEWIEEAFHVLRH